MRFNILCVVLLVVVCMAMVESTSSKTSNSNPLPASDSDSTEDCDDVSDAIEELYKDLCTVSCDRKDYFCNKVIIRYIKPLCDYQSALKASKAIIVKLGCTQMRYRKKIICKTTSKKACELAEEVADFCDAADASDGDCGKQPIKPTNTPAATSTTTESVTTLNPGPLASDNRCDTFRGKCYLGNCPSTLTAFDICETSGYICCK